MQEICFLHQLARQAVIALLGKGDSSQRITGMKANEVCRKEIVRNHTMVETRNHVPQLSQFGNREQWAAAAPDVQYPGHTVPSDDVRERLAKVEAILLRCWRDDDPGTKVAKGLCLRSGNDNWCKTPRSLRPRNEVAGDSKVTGIDQPLKRAGALLARKENKTYVVCHMRTTFDKSNRHPLQSGSDNSLERNPIHQSGAHSIFIAATRQWCQAYGVHCAALPVSHLSLADLNGLGKLHVNDRSVFPGSAGFKPASGFGPSRRFV